jgi:hypothetical protein
MVDFMEESEERELGWIIDSSSQIQPPRLIESSPSTLLMQFSVLFDMCLYRRNDSVRLIMQSTEHASNLEGLSFPAGQSSTNKTTRELSMTVHVC